MAKNTSSKRININLVDLVEEGMPVRPFVGVFNLNMKLIASSKNHRTDDVAESVRIGGKRLGWGDSIIDDDADAQVLELNGAPCAIVVGAANMKQAVAMGQAAIIDLL